MKALLQRVQEAQVSVHGECVGAIGKGLLIFVCGESGDGKETIDLLARKACDMRIFADEAGKMNRSLKDVGGQALVVSQFTLAADWKKGNRPDFSKAASAAEGKQIYESFTEALKGLGVPTRTGRFGEEMAVELINDGPVTIWMDTHPAS